MPGWLAGWLVLLSALSAARASTLVGTESIASAGGVAPAPALSPPPVLPGADEAEVLRIARHARLHPVARPPAAPRPVLSRWERLGRQVRRRGRRALQHYDHLLDERYFLMSFWQGGVLACLGDVIVQCQEAGPFDVARVVHLSVLGFLLDGVAAAWYYELLDRMDPARSVLSVAWKTVVGTAAFGPVLNGLFVAGVMLMKDLGRSWDPRHFARALAVITVKDVQLWPIMDILSFAFLPKTWRPLAASGMCLLFNIHISEEANVGEHEAAGSMPWPRLGFFLERVYLRMVGSSEDA